MATTLQILTGILTMNDDEFFAIKDEDLRSRESWLLDQDYFGIAINVPRHLSTELHDHLPLIVATRFNGERDWDLNLNGNCLLIGTNMIDGSVHYTHLLRSDKELTDRGEEETQSLEPRPSDEELEGEAAQLLDINIRDLLDIPWSYGKWVFGVIHYDWLSNLAPIKLDGDAQLDLIEPITFDPELYARATTDLVQENNIEMPEHGTSYTVTCHSDPMKPHLIVDGAFSIYARRYNLLSEYIQAEINAVIPVSLLLLQPNCEEPWHYSWVVPAHGDPLEKGDTAEGKFSIDIQIATGNPGPPPGDYISYLILAGHIYGPQNLNITK